MKLMENSTNTIIGEDTLEESILAGYGRIGRLRRSIPKGAEEGNREKISAEIAEILKKIEELKLQIK